jgi:hypothetical protein
LAEGDVVDGFEAKVGGVLLLGGSAVAHDAGLVLAAVGHGRVAHVGNALGLAVELGLDLLGLLLGGVELLPELLALGHEPLHLCIIAISISILQTLVVHLLLELLELICHSIPLSAHLLDLEIEAHESVVEGDGSVDVCALDLACPDAGRQFIRMLLHPFEIEMSEQILWLLLMLRRVVGCHRRLICSGGGSLACKKTNRSRCRQPSPGGGAQGHHASRAAPSGQAQQGLAQQLHLFHQRKVFCILLLLLKIK